MVLGGLVLGTLIHYLRGTRIMMFQLSGFYYRLYPIFAATCNGVSLLRLNRRKRAASILRAVTMGFGMIMLSYTITSPRNPYYLLIKGPILNLKPL